MIARVSSNQNDAACIQLTFTNESRRYMPFDFGHGLSHCWRLGRTSKKRTVPSSSLGWCAAAVVCSQLHSKRSVFKDLPHSIYWNEFLRTRDFWLLPSLQIQNMRHVNQFYLWYRVEKEYSKTYIRVGLEQMPIIKIISTFCITMEGKSMMIRKTPETEGRQW